MSKRIKLSSLKHSFIGAVRRDKLFPHYIVLYNAWGRPILSFIPSGGDVYAGDGNLFDDNIKDEK